MAEPFQHLGDIRFMREGICCGRRAHRMNAPPIDLDIQARGLPVFWYYPSLVTTFFQSVQLRIVAKDPIFYKCRYQTV